MSDDIHNPWRESLENCISGDNYLRSSEYRDLIEELDELYRLRAALSQPQAAQPCPFGCTTQEEHDAHQPQAEQPAPQETHVIVAIRPGRHLTRDGRSVYIASRASVDRHGSPNPYPWLVECGGSGWSVDDAGRHMQNGASGFDIVARADATPPTEEKK